MLPIKNRNLPMYKDFLISVMVENYLNGVAHIVVLWRYI